MPALIGGLTGSQPRRRRLIGGDDEGGGFTTRRRPTSQSGPVNPINSAMNAYGKAARAGEAEEERRGADMEAMLREADAAANVPTFSDEDLRRQFARGADAAGDKFLNQMMDIREYAGMSGVGGGQVVGQLANAEIQRLGQLTQSYGDAVAFKATSDALDRQNAFDRKANVLAQAINRPISMLGIDFANQNAQVQLGKYAIDKNLEGDKAMAGAQEKSSSNGLIGSIFGGIGGLVGGLL